MGSSMRCTSGSWTTLRRSVLSGLLALAPAWAMAQAISDVPLAVKNNVPPNMMFMIDNSGSMFNILSATPYSASLSIDVSSTCTAAQTVSTTSQVNISIAAGVPRFTVAGAGPYRHVTVPEAGSGTSAANQRCFTNTATYSAKLYFPLGSYLPAQYTGHYLNWYFGTYFSHPATGWVDRKVLSAAAVAAGGAVNTRMEVARVSAKAAVDTLPLVISGTTIAATRIGLSTYNSGNGGTLLSAMGDLDAAKRTSVKSSIDTLTPTGNTPLAETLADIGRYMSTGYSGNITAGTTTVNIDTFLAQDSRNSCLSGAPSCSGAGTDAIPASPSTGTPSRPIQYWCQRSYVFMMTDGRSQGDQAFTLNTYLRDYDGDCTGVNAVNCTGVYDRKIARTYESAGSDYLDDVAKALYDVDLRPNLVAPVTNPVTAKANNLLTYAIGFADSTVTNDPLLINAALQGGGLFFTADSQSGLTTAFTDVIADAFSKDAAASAVAVANAQITVNNIGYATSYNSGSWYGALEAYSMNTTTGLQEGSAIWRAQAELEILGSDPSLRKIVSFDGSAGLAFTAANVASFDTGGSTPLTAGVIDYLRGVRTGEVPVPPATVPVYRPRQFLLGDIINAEPVVVTYSGVSIVYQGANDGMLHVVDGRTSGSTMGQELWAYVPRLLHRNLAQLASPSYEHKYFVDATPATALAGSVRLLVGGLGKGGAGYYALDITDYTAASETAAASKVEWEFTHANMGYSFGTPLIVNTAAGWRVVVASGYGNGTGGPGGAGDGRGYVWVLDPSTGTVVSTMTTNVGTSANPSGLAYLASLANVASDAVVRYVYGGDLQGNVWRFDLNTSAVVRIATLTDGAGAYQPVTAPPTVGAVGGSSTKFFVYVGTGRYLADEDVPGNAGANTWATQRQTQYGIVDDTANASPSLPNIRGTNGSTCPSGGGTSDFVCQSTTYVAGTNTYTTTNHAVDTTAKRGWYIDLPADTNLTNGRMTTQAALTTGGTLAFTVNVPTNLKCEPGGSSWFFAFNASTGGSVPSNPGATTFHDAGSFLGTALASRPVIVQAAAGKRALIRMSDKTVQSKEVPEYTPPASSNATWKRIYWRPLN